MTEKEAKRSFCEVAPKGRDKPAFRTAWSGYVDGLVRDGKVSETRARGWRGPQRCAPASMLGRRPVGFAAAPLAGTGAQHAASARQLTLDAERYANGVSAATSCAGAVDKLTHAASVMGAAGRDRRWAKGHPGEAVPSDTAAAEIALERAKASVVKKCGG